MGQKGENTVKQECIAGIVLCLIGLALLFVPIGSLWKITEGWKTKNGKPSKAFAWIARILGVVFTGVGAVLFITGL